MAKGEDKKRVIYPDGFNYRPPAVLEYIGFQMESVTPTCVQGRFVVSETSAQARGVLHGGISAYIAESLGSIGAHVASGFQPVAGVDLSTSHLRPAPIGLEIEAKATPVHIGHRLQNDVVQGEKQRTWGFMQVEVHRGKGSCARKSIECVGYFSCQHIDNMGMQVTFSCNSNTRALTG